VPRGAELTAEPGTNTAIDVIVGVVMDAAGRVLIARRPAGKHMAGAWEFPGGKLGDGESPLAGLCRELEEEIGIVVSGAEPFVRHCFDYADRSVRLDVWWVLAHAGEVTACEGQELRWVDAVALARMPMLPADEPIVAAVCERLGPR
jgi:8-oxo-dGTP diphosphatase